MKNIFKTALASIVLMASCATDEEVVSTISTPDSFYASIEAPETRTYADENGKLLWTENDRLTVFMGNTYPRQYKYTGVTGQNHGQFDDLTDPSQVISGNALSTNYSIYPYAPNTTISNEGVINYTIPATQSYAENSFGLGANVMVAVTENKDDKFLSFKNLGGYIEFSLYGTGTTVKSIEFKGNNGENLEGAVEITATHEDNPTFEFVGEATKTLTLDCGEGVELGNEENPTTFWFVVPAMTYSNGITITITDTENKVMEKSTSNSITIERSTIQPLNAFLVETEEVIPNNQIWYTSTDGEVVTPKYTNVFGTTYKSNVYENGKGVITFEGDVTSIGNEAFMGCTTLSNVSIPSSVVTIGNNAFRACDKLTEITIPYGVTSIEPWTFDNCWELKTVTIPESVTTIGESAFRVCMNLNSIKIPDSVESIEREAFAGCSAFTSFTIPESVTVIGYNVFWNCSKLTSIYCKPTTPPTIDQYAFINTPAELIIYVPAASVNYYLNAYRWKDYADKIEEM